MNRRERQAVADEVPYWWHSIDLGEGVVTRGRKGRRQLEEELEALRLPNLRGRTVLDVGAWDGYFSFHAEEAGAERVVALDWWTWGMSRHEGRADRIEQLDLEKLPGRRGFDLARRLRDSAVEPVVADFNEVDPAGLGAFDVVLFLGVLYHQRDPLPALRKLRAVTRGRAVIETHGIVVPGFEERPLWEHYPGRELNDDPTNWWGPNARGLLDACRSAGFAHAELASPPRVPMVARDGIVHCRLVVHAFAQAPSTDPRGSAGAREAPGGDSAAGTAPLGDLSAELTKARAHAAKADRELATLAASRSWRLTRPLRAIRRRLKR